MSESINAITSLAVVFGVCAVFITRETPAIRDRLAAWAASRSYGLKCARAEYEQRQRMEA